MWSMLAQRSFLCKENRGSCWRMLGLGKQNLLRRSKPPFLLVFLLAKTGRERQSLLTPCRACTMGLIALEWLKLSLVLSCFCFFNFVFHYIMFDWHIFSLFGSETRLVLEAHSSTQEYECNLVMRLKNKDSMVDHFCMLTWRITCKTEPLWGIHIHIYLYIYSSHRDMSRKLDSI